MLHGKIAHQGAIGRDSRRIGHLPGTTGDVRTYLDIAGHSGQQRDDAEADVHQRQVKDENVRPGAVLKWHRGMVSQLPARGGSGAHY